MTCDALWNRSEPTVNKALVTGATGFVGSHLVELLAEAGVGVRALVRRTSDTRLLDQLGVGRIEGDLHDAPALARAAQGVDVVFHLAALTRARSREEFFRVNARAVEGVAGAAAEAGARLVFLSSLAAVGPALDGRAVRETDPPKPITDYGRSKLDGEAACTTAVPGEVVILRAPAVYGPRDRDIYRFFAMAARGFVAMPTGPQRRIQMLYVRDLVEALVAAGRTKGARLLYHVAEARSYTWREVAELVGEAVGRRVHVVPVPPVLVGVAAVISELSAKAVGRTTIFTRDKARELLAPGWLCDTAAAERDLGYTARTPLATGLKATADWYRARGWL